MSLRTLVIRGVLIGGIVATVNFPATTATRRMPKPAATAKVPLVEQAHVRQAPAPAPAAKAPHAAKAPSVR
jgi:hypothetical protein